MRTDTKGAELKGQRVGNPTADSISQFLTAYSRATNVVLTEEKGPQCDLARISLGPDRFFLRGSSRKVHKK
jgi:hypothetical protein